MANVVYIATSLDGYIADREGGLDWLEMIPNPEGSDLGWGEFISQIDALVMGRNTFETICGFDVEWPYPVPVFVLSNSMTSIPEAYRDRAELVSGPLPQIVESLSAKGFTNLYIDGGRTVQSFLQADLIDELTITRLPIQLGGGVALFSSLPKPLEFEHVKTEVLLGEMVQTRYRRKR